MRPTRFFLALGVLFLVGAALMDRSPHAVRAQSAPPVHAANPTYSLYCGLWRVDNGLVSTIHIKNALVVAPL